MDKVAILIDGGYLAAILRDRFGEPRIDFLALSNKLSEGYERFRTYYYNCMPWQSSPPTEPERLRYSNMNKFIVALKKSPRFEVRLGKLRKSNTGELQQKRVDILMAVDLVRMSWQRQINKAVLITGDSDFVPAVENAKDAGVITHLYYAPGTFSDELFTVCDERTEITKELVDSVKRTTPS
ncbi:MAG: NYN domain-containing protein [Thaumarchaeota archaeon]|nr:NYN domain-containing protein [Nitrososphaerota archaeon]